MSDSDVAALEEAGRAFSCGECRHWKHIAQSKGGGAKVLSPTRMGQCREGPPCIQPTAQGNLMIDYLPLPETFPACGRFVVSLRLV